MQEVKATFLSALERLREFPEMKFTCTSTAFLEWFEKVEPERFEEIRQRAAEPAGIIRRKGMTCSHGYRSQGKEFISIIRFWSPSARHFRIVWSGIRKARILRILPWKIRDIRATGLRRLRQWPICRIW